MIGPDLDNIHNAKMVVSDLRDGGIGLVVCFTPAPPKALGMLIAQETAPGEFIQLRLGQNPVSVSFGRSNSKISRPARGR